MFRIASATLFVCLLGMLFLQANRWSSVGAQSAENQLTPTLDPLDLYLDLTAYGYLEGNQPCFDENFYHFVRLNVHNRGTANAGSFLVDVAYRNNTTDKYVIDFLNNNSTASLDLGANFESALVDSSDLIRETNEGNNLFDGPIVTPTPPPPCTPTPPPCPTITPSPTITPRSETGITATPSPHPCPTPPPCPTITPSPTITPRSESGITATPSPHPCPTTRPPTPFPPTRTPTPTPCIDLTPYASPTPRVTPEMTNTPTNTPTPATATLTPTPTFTPTPCAAHNFMPVIRKDDS